MGKNDWQRLYRIEKIQIKETRDGFLGIRMFERIYRNEKFAIIDNKTGDILGQYDDHRYAVKQARYKYKKTMNKIDKILLS